MHQISEQRNTRNKQCGVGGHCLMYIYVSLLLLYTMIFTLTKLRARRAYIIHAYMYDDGRPGPGNRLNRLDKWCAQSSRPPVAVLSVSLPPGSTATETSAING